MAPSEDGKTSFWTTLPGILTGIAGVLAAAATLVGVIRAVTGGSAQANAKATLPASNTGSQRTAGHRTGGQTVGNGSGQSVGGQSGNHQSGRDESGSGESGSGESGNDQSGNDQSGSGHGGSQGSGDSGSSTVAPKFVGEWRNVDSATRSTTRYVITRNGDILSISGFGSCSPTDCDWAQTAGGPRTVSVSDASDGQFSIVWNFGFKTQTDAIKLLSDGRLQVVSTHKYTDARPERQETQLFAKGS